MPTTKTDLKEWFVCGAKQKATHMIVVCDTFSYEDYPVFVYEDQNVKIVAEGYEGPNMQKVMEVYNLKLDMEAQLNEHRAFHY